MRFKVPQNVQRADQILWFITLPQLIVLLVTGGFSYMLFTSLNKTYVLGGFQNFLIWTPLMIGAAFAFVKIKGLSLTKFILLLIEHNLFLPKRRYWQAGASPMVSMTADFSEKTDKKKKNLAVKEISDDKFKNLAALLDGENPASN